MTEATPELKLSTEVEAEIDKFGNATKTRRWVFHNISQRVLDLLEFYMSFDVTSGNVRDLSSGDSDGADASAIMSVAPGGLPRIKCRFGKRLRPEEKYTVWVSYKHDSYFRYMPKTNVWLLSEWFARDAPLLGVDFQQEEIQQIKFDLKLHDPRLRLLGVPNFLRTFDWEAEPPPNFRDKTGAIQTLTWHRGIRVDDRTEDIVVLYKKGWIFEKVGPLIRAVIPFLPKP